MISIADLKEIHKDTDVSVEDLWGFDGAFTPLMVALDHFIRQKYPEPARYCEEGYLTEEVCITGRDFASIYYQIPRSEVTEEMLQDVNLTVDRILSCIHLVVTREQLEDSCPGYTEKARKEWDKRSFYCGPDEEPPEFEDIVSMGRKCVYITAFGRRDGDWTHLISECIIPGAMYFDSPKTIENRFDDAIAEMFRKEAEQ